MAKPWARIEVGYWDHIKFQSLNANAICLWHEGKNYCDKHHTDGLLPLVVVRQFRFYGKKVVDALATSCETPKPDGTRYAPLWETHAVGFKMHDYLDHNDCRDVVEARMAAAEARRAAERARKADWRAQKQALSQGVSHDLSRGTNGTCPVDVPALSRSTTEAEALTEAEPERAFKTAATPLALAKEPNERGNYRPVAKLAGDLARQGWWMVEGEKFLIQSEANLVDALKDECGRLRMTRDADMVHRAAASEWFKHSQGIGGHANTEAEAS